MATATATRDQLLKMEAVADRLNVSRSTAYDLLYSGRMPYHRIGRALRVRESDLEAFLSSCRLAADLED